MKKPRPLNERVGTIDELRGISILLMVVYHFFYDLVCFYGVFIPLFSSPALDFLRDLFAGLFIFLSGISCRFSRNNLRRGVLCFACGMLLTLVTSIFLPDEIIWFGILHLLGLSMIFFSFLRPLLDLFSSPLPGLILFSFLFLLSYRVPHGYLLGIELSPSLYQIDLLSPLGLPTVRFFSSDYFPLIPWFFLFLAGSCLGVYIIRKKFPVWLYQTHCSALAAVGRHTLLIYLLHQPVLFGLLYLIMKGR